MKRKTLVYLIHLMNPSQDVKGYSKDELQGILSHNLHHLVLAHNRPVQFVGPRALHTLSLDTIEAAMARRRATKYPPHPFAFETHDDDPRND